MRGAPAWAMAILGGLSMSAGRLFGLVELYVIGAGLMLCVVAAIIHVRTRFVHVAMTREVDPVHPMAGAGLTVALTLTSQRRTPACELIDLVDETGRVGLTLTPLARHRTARVRYKVPTQRRGVLTLGPAMVEISDPLGLLSRRRQVGTPTDVIVHPQWTPIDLPDPQYCQGALIDLIRHLIDHMSVNLEFRSLREYVTGDDLRRVNWKASARRDILTLNEYEARAPLVVHALVDAQESTYSPEGFERAVSVAASFVGSTLTTLQESEPRLHLSCPAHYDAPIDDATRFDAMRSLAEITCFSTSHPPALLNDPGEFRVNVIICGNRDRHWLDSTDRSMGTGHATVVIYCETPTESTFDHDHWLALTCVDFNDFNAQWGALSRRKANG